ncbi:hypothetical protein BS50DRAFT_629954 [Corynespora cassiicola Philippines]|uniref:RING-type domain-containing protein n=1 Tax=Corynespora cassiicola Philippines TaxID=1448308 RepID=A0A2T2P2H2_CORCC|nr:hypothetical protein BS50DRAFT_629954 [Corynespora cassiicola Philippines]
MSSMNSMPLTKQYLGHFVSDPNAFARVSATVLDLINDATSCINFTLDYHVSPEPMIRLIRAVQWDNTRAYILKSHAEVQQPLPPFEIAWNEAKWYVRESFTYLSSNMDEEYRGVVLRQLEADFFDQLSRCPEFADIVEELFDTQPRYIRQVSNLEEHWHAERNEDEPFVELSQLLCDYRNNAPALTCILQFFSAMTLFIANDAAHAYGHGVKHVNPDRISLYVADLEAWIKKTICSPLCSVPLEIREQLTKVNFQGCYGFILNKALGLLDNVAANELEWELQYWLTNCAWKTMDSRDRGDLITEVLQELKLDEFLDDDQLDPRPYYRFPQFDRWDVPVAYLAHGDDDAEYEDFYGMEHFFEDIHFEPVGSPLLVENFASHATIPTEIKEDVCTICLEGLSHEETELQKLPAILHACKHTFHYGCIGELINGIEEFSNLCPNCREPICQQRERKVILPANLTTELSVSDNVSDVFNGYVHGSDSGETQSDRDGDVVMTDA